MSLIWCRHLSKGASETLFCRCAATKLYKGETIRMDESMRKKTMEACQTLMTWGWEFFLCLLRKRKAIRSWYEWMRISRQFVIRRIDWTWRPPNRKFLKPSEDVVKQDKDNNDNRWCNEDSCCHWRANRPCERQIPPCIEGREFNQMAMTNWDRNCRQKRFSFHAWLQKTKWGWCLYWKRRVRLVAVTGDGWTDAPALQKSGHRYCQWNNGFDVAKEGFGHESSSMIFRNYCECCWRGRGGGWYMKTSKSLSPTSSQSNIPEAIPYLAYILVRIPLPLTIIQILAVDLGTDMLPALALAAENPTPGIMKQPPRKLKERLLNFPLIARALSVLWSNRSDCLHVRFLFCFAPGKDRHGEIMLLPTNTLYLQAIKLSIWQRLSSRQIGNNFGIAFSSE